MHEFSMVEHLVAHLDAQLRAQHAQQVKTIRLRKGSIFAASELKQAFELLTKDTALAGAALEIEESATEQPCFTCGKKPTITTDDLVDHLFYCPLCGSLGEVDEERGLLITGIQLADDHFINMQLQGHRPLD